MNRIITSLVAVLVVVSAQAQTASTTRETPKLVIGITIDQLRGDYLELFKHTFTERGFKRLFNEGLVYQNMRFEFPGLNDASAIATIYTGATPFYHGITGRDKYQVDKKRVASTFDDENFLGNYTQDKVSPTAIKVTTISDELKIASRGISDVYSFAPEAHQALITAGRAGNCAFWVEDYSGKWASSTYYYDFHWVVDQENKNPSAYSEKAFGMQWNSLPITYNAFAYTQGNSFQHNLGGNQDTYKRFKKTPFVNEDVRDITSKLMGKAELGKRISPDFLSLTFYAGNYPKAEEYSLEIQDTYARLDREIEKLLDEVDKTVGLKNTLIFVTSTGYYNSNEIKPNELNPIRIADGIFYTNRCEALLNMYLMAIYGKEKWVDKFYNRQIYLNRKLIEDKQLSLKEIQQKAAEFVSEFTGVQEVYTSYQLRLGEWNPVMEYYRNGFTKETAGDLFVEIQPGFKIVNEHDKRAKDEQVRNNAVTCPVFFFGYNIKPAKVKRTIKATEIAPTISYIMRIRAPSAANEQALAEFL